MREIAPEELKMWINSTKNVENFKVDVENFMLKNFATEISRSNFDSTLDKTQTHTARIAFLTRAVLVPV